MPATRPAGPAAAHPVQGAAVSGTGRQCTMATEYRVAPEELLAFATASLQAVGADDWTVEVVADALVNASVRGTDSHGVRLLSGYCASARSGFTNPRPKYTVETPYPAFVVVDADQGFGLAAGCRGIDLAVELARKYGVATVAVKNSRHAGPMAAYTTRAAAQGCIAMAMTSVPPAMRSFNGSRPFFGTNPIAVVRERLRPPLSRPDCLQLLALPA